MEADIITSRGTVTIQLEHVKTPRAVANFITLAQGSRSWVDSRSGAVKDDPFFAGLPFFRVENTGSSKFAESGSLSGNGTDDPGYTILDEFDASLVHTPYVIAMSSGGPNTGGSRFYLTGNVSMPLRDNRHVVIGSIPSGASRLVVDHILSAGADATTITSVVIRRTGTALTFDEFSVPLPHVGTVDGSLAVQRNVAANLVFPRTASTVVRAHASTDLQTWLPHYHSFVGLDDAIPSPVQKLDNADLSRRFYNLSLTAYPDAGGPAGFANRTLTIDAPGFGEIVYDFNPAGTGGSYVNIPAPGFPPFTGSFTVQADPPPRYEGYYVHILLATPGLGGAASTEIRGGFDTIGQDSVTGRSRTSLLDAEKDLIFEDEGTLELTRP